MLENTSDSGHPLWQPPTQEFLPSHLQQNLNKRPGDGLSVAGLIARSDRSGRWFVYTSLDMRRRLEIVESDIIDFEQLTEDESAFGKLGGTRVYLRNGAEIKETRGPVQEEGDDDFDLDVRISAAGPQKPKDTCEGTEGGTTCAAECGGGDTELCGDGTDDCGTGGCTVGCPHKTDNTCKTDCGATCNENKTCITCHTCNTKCNQHTCAGTCQTCNTQCQQNTCVNTQCQQNTCHTCETKCQQKTCHTCETCHACTHVTCGHQPGCIPV